MEPVLNQINIQLNLEDFQPTANLHKKKKYCKVNDSIKTLFLEYMIEKNMSIKQASQRLNINYSSAKAILAQHRKTILHVKKASQRNAKQASYREINPFQTMTYSIDQFICSTGGKQMSRQSYIFKHTPTFIIPIIISNKQNQSDNVSNTENSSESQ